MILDSSFLIDLMENSAGAIKFAKKVESNGATQRVPAQVVYELFVGVGYTEMTEQEISKVQSVLDARPTVKTTPEIARLAGRMDGQLRREGNRVSESDIIIGATGRHFGEPVVTNNEANFERLPEVNVVSYDP